jgi:hypothetical protein
VAPDEINVRRGRNPIVTPIASSQQRIAAYESGRPSVADDGRRVASPG